MPLPEPERGLVISYAYLWHHEHRAGLEEGRKDRPCVIVLAADRTEHGMMVTVVPITHVPPSKPASAMEVPAAVKQHLGLDADRSWVILDEGNRFIWPGYDLRPIPGTRGRYDYGFLPPRLFAALVERFKAVWQIGQASISSRD
jgi:hypothetical protein